MLFETIYRWFTALFGFDLADYLSGYICETEEAEAGYLGSNQFIMYGFIALGIALAIVLIYYYVVNHPRFNKWWSWLVMLLVAGTANFLIGGFKTIGDLNAGNIGECLVNSENGGVSASDCWMFGLSNFFISSIFFIILSISLKWWSSNCKRSPF